MLRGPDFSSSDEDGLSDDNEYEEFKMQMKKRHEVKPNEANSAAEQKKKKFQYIMSAILYAREEVVLNELEKGLEIDVDLELGWTPLLLTATVANEKIITELLNRGANINQEREGFTPLMLLCNNPSEDDVVKNNITACTKLLLNSRANINAIDHKRRTALMLAAYNGHLEAVKLMLPYVDKEAEDNQRWTALFWAVDGHKTEIVELLLKEGFNYDKVDIRGNTIADIAHTNGYEDILTLLPKNTSSDDFYLYLNNNQLNIETTFKDLNGHQKPELFVNVCKILFGTRSESVIPVFCEKNITLFDLLSINDAKLKEIGIQLPYQRNRILGGLFKFHKHPFQPKSIPFIQKNQLYTNIDISSTVLSCIRQLIAMEASLKFIIENYTEKLSSAEKHEIGIIISKNRSKINRLAIVSEEFITKTQMWDSLLNPVDKITKKRWNVPWCSLYLSVSIASLAVFIVLKTR